MIAVAGDKAVGRRFGESNREIDIQDQRLRIAAIQFDWNCAPSNMWFLWVLLIAVILWRRRHLYKVSWQLPGPFALPLIGNVLAMWNEDGK